MLGKALRVTLLTVPGKQEGTVTDPGFERLDINGSPGRELFQGEKMEFGEISHLKLVPLAAKDSLVSKLLEAFYTSARFLLLSNP